MKLSRTILIAALPLMLASFAAAQVVASDPPAPAPAAPPPLIMPGDTLEISVVRRSEFDWRGSIDSAGMLSGIPYVDEPVRAVCRTEDAVAKDLTTAFTKYLVAPVVSVRVVDHNGRAPAMVLGAVRTAQRYLMQRPARLNELIALSGGITDRASGDIQVYRTDNYVCRPSAEAGGELVLMMDDTSAAIRVIKIRQLIGGDANANPVIRAGDIVTVLESQPVYITGGVNAPQGVGYTDGLTLTRALAMAGGLSGDARGGDIRIYRREAKAGEPALVEADLSAIKSGKQKDPPLFPYDIITVPQGGRGAAPRPSMNDLLDALTRKDAVASLPLRVVN